MNHSLKKRITIAVIFALALAYLEAVVVVYLRKIFEPPFLSLAANAIEKREVIFSFGIISFLKSAAAIKIIPDSKIILIEQFREVATILIIFCFSLISARRLKRKFGFFFLIFALWDIYYYIFLYLLIGWPKSLFDTDVLFLIPSPWIAPVILPIVISFLMIVSSYLLFKR